jgi:hypothetical protein
MIFGDQAGIVSPLMNDRYITRLIQPTQNAARLITNVEAVEKVLKAYNIAISLAEK